MFDFSKWESRDKVVVQSKGILENESNEYTVERSSTRVVESKLLLPEQRTVLSFFGYTNPVVYQILTEFELQTDGKLLHAEVIKYDIHILKDLVNPDTFKKLQGNILNLKQSWSCPICKKPQFQDMIECEDCLTWYHWNCISPDKEITDKCWICSGCNANKFYKISKKC